ncbi:hypothetical protein L1987_41464 [Smallanthus sonchifolius]|uniref:Uncharacterized protein n=1 Tax=Smallanthus sonchifolius TaxID=185202 RepID=A0ACB9GVS9_9ASTR|nr:hypothetical protein L1987_41464 [Smallanthus sonchifolius]
MAPQKLLVKVGMEALSTANERLLAKKGRSSSVLQQSCHYQYVPQYPIVHLLAPESTTDCCKASSMLTAEFCGGGKLEFDMGLGLMAVLGLGVAKRIGLRHQEEQIRAG